MLLPSQMLAEIRKSKMHFSFYDKLKITSIITVKLEEKMQVHVLLGI